MPHHMIAQLIGFVAVCCTFTLYQFNNRRQMLVISLCGAMLYALSFGLLGARTGLTMNLLSAVRVLVFSRYDSTQRPVWVMYTFIILFIGGGLISWQGWYSILPIIGMVSSTVAFWQLKPVHIRRLSLISPPCWFIYNLIVGSYAGMAAEVVNISSNLSAMWRFDWRTRSHTKRPTIEE
jgi:hypothetical protein